MQVSQILYNILDEFSQWIPPVFTEENGFDDF